MSDRTDLVPHLRTVATQDCDKDPFFDVSDHICSLAADRIEELERHNQSLANDFQRFYDGIPWEEIETLYVGLTNKGVLGHSIGPVLHKILALREEGNEFRT